MGIAPYAHHEAAAERGVEDAAPYAHHEAAAERGVEDAAPYEILSFIGA